MDIQFCIKGCGNIAVGTGYWQGRGNNRNPHEPWTPDHCRAHHLERIAPLLVRCEVTAPDGVEIVDARTGVEVGRGGIVELDPVETNIALLAAGGLVKLAAAVKAEPKKA